MWIERFLAELKTPDPIPPEPAGSRWHLFFILPNLSLGDTTPFVSEYVCICSASDRRVKALDDTPGDKTGAQMLKAFRTWFGRAYEPSCLLVRADAPAIFRDAEVLRAFRNICAIAALTNGWARGFDGGQWIPTYSDFFFFASHSPGKSGWIGNLHGMVEGMNDDVAGFVGQCAGQIDGPSGFSVVHDRGLLLRLLRAWNSYYVRQPTDTALLPLFRSLEVAFQAARFPSDGLSSINDVGTRIGLWVSAFEVLFHPGSGRNVNKHVVQQALSRFEFREPKLRRKAYSYTWGRPAQTFPTNFVGVIYDELYRARNDFMHGNPVTHADVRLRRTRRYPPLWTLAPILYNVALRTYMRSMFALSARQRLEDVDDKRVLSTALSTVRSARKKP